MRIIHTADWQIGKPFLRFGSKAERLRNARLDAIETIGRLAVAEGAAHVLVAGDVFDSETPSNATLRAPMERMRGFPRVTWHLLPGNHDPHRPAGIWDRFQAAGAPGNVRVHTTPESVALGEGGWLLPAPLTSKSETRDLTVSMEAMATPEGATRIGFAHGSVVNFEREGDANNPIDPTRAERAGLAYLALGDWHGTRSITDRIWYAGTPEKERFDSQPLGQVLLVSLDGPRALPVVEVKTVGTFRWRAETIALSDPGQLADFEAMLRRDAEPLSRLVLKLAIVGAASLAQVKPIGDFIERLDAAVCHLDYDDSALRIAPSDADLESIDFDGVLRQAAERLKRRLDDTSLSEHERNTARQALVMLYLEGTAAA